MLVAVFLAVASAAPQFFGEQQRPQVVITKQAQEHDTERQKYSYRLASTTLISFHQHSKSPTILDKRCSSKSTDYKLFAEWISSFEADNGIAVSESGNLKEIGPSVENVGVVSRGSFSYPGDDGNRYTVNWVADENGFQPTAAHLPTPPPMPAHVVQLLADLRAAGKL